MRQPNVVTAKAPRQKDPQYKSRHKQQRLRAARLEQKAWEKAEAAFNRRAARTTRRVESAFKDCRV